jgi:hypothetical protein
LYLDGIEDIALIDEVTLIASDFLSDRHTLMPERYLVVNRQLLAEKHLP